jgi:REP element-mobilizing transposase RayT
MPNHVHLILKPTEADALGRAVGEAHRRYTNFINARGRWTGHLFQSRFASVVLEAQGQTGCSLKSQDRWPHVSTQAPENP